MLSFVEQIVKYGSLSIVGLEKNTGKTETLNYILRQLPKYGVRVAVSSIGVDGEPVDQVTMTDKPEITLTEGTIFTTSEKHYRERALHSEILAIDDEQTALGRLITARTLSQGKIILSGPSSTASLERWVGRMKGEFGVDLTIIDGALSRLSLASPAVSEAMVLATGAALSQDPNVVVRKTAFVVEMIKLPITEIDSQLRGELEEKEDGIWIVERGGKIVESEQRSAFDFEMLLLDDENREGEEEVTAIYLTGALTDRFLNAVTDKLLNKRGRGRGRGRVNEQELDKFKDFELITRDFTRIFIEPLTYRRFTSAGGRLRLLKRSHLVAITVNPTAPSGVVLDSELLCRAIERRTETPTFDIVRDGDNI